MIALLAAALFTSTLQVEGLAAAGGTLWAATGGGVEQHALPSGARIRLYTTEDGLSSDDVREVRIEDGVVHARMQAADCVLREGRFQCVPAGPIALSPLPAPLWHGARETARLDLGGQVAVATAGGGLWLGDRRITPPGQICSNHLEALAEWQGKLWAGAFDGGLCVREGGKWRTLRAPFRMVNDLRPTPQGLWVASAEGLFITRDGRRFRRERRVRERGVNRLAIRGKWLYATSPVALYAIRIGGRDRMRRWLRPAGSTALQAVAASGADLWLASEDRGMIRLRRGRFELFDRASGLPSSWMVDVAPAPGGGVWAATLRNGAVRLGRDGRVRERSRDPDSWGLRLYPDRGAVLFGTQQGLDGFSRLPDPRVHAMLRTAEGLWIGTEGGLVLVVGSAPL